MHLFLTSSPCDDDVPAGCELPCIFFEKNRFVENLRRCYQPGELMVVIAAAPDKYALNDEMAYTFHHCLQFHGIGYPATMIVDNRNREDCAELVKAASFVILGGGHVPTQNRFLKELGVKALLRDFEGVVMGISAGSMNACGNVYAQPEEPGEATDPAYQRFISGLDLTDVMVLPHYQRVKDTYVDGFHLFRDLSIPDSRGRRTFYALPDASYVYQHDGIREVFGECWRIHDGQMEKWCEDGCSRSI